MSWSQFQSDIITAHVLQKSRHRGSNQSDRTKKKQPYALFTIDGQRILDEDSIEMVDTDDNDSDTTASTNPWWVEVLAQQFGMVLLYEGGQFVWPGVHIGFERHVSLYSIMPINSPNMDHHPTRNVTLVTLSLSPLVLSVHGFLSIEECHYIQTIATPTLAYSDVVLMDHDAGRPATDFRTSQTTFLDDDDDADHDDPTLIDIDYRTASLIRIPRNHQEPVQVLRYGINEKYSSHHDYFNPQLYQNDRNTLDMIQYGKRNRFVTVFWYLSTVPQGGETIFPRAYGQYERSSNDCETGLKVRPELGKVIVFYNMKMDGTIDPQSLHGACPVRQGIKWAANKWIWNEPMSYVPL
jgi:prolyl 4-hydroxylase